MLPSAFLLAHMNKMILFSFLCLVIELTVLIFEYGTSFASLEQAPLVTVYNFLISSPGFNLLTFVAVEDFCI